MKNLETLIYKSTCFFQMNHSEMIATLQDINQELGLILSDTTTYSYDVYRTLLILTHNFNTFMNPDYLVRATEYSYFNRKLTAYYEGGGSKEILPYLCGIDCYQSDLEATVLHGKQKFVVTSFYSFYQGIPEQLKYFCEVPDFYPELTTDIKDKIYEKKDS